MVWQGYKRFSVDESMCGSGGIVREGSRIGVSLKSSFDANDCGRSNVSVRVSVSGKCCIGCCL